MLIKVMLQPNARQNEIVGMHGEYLKIRVMAPAVEGQANAALIKLLATHYEVPTRCVKIVAGQQSRYKTVAITPC